MKDRRIRSASGDEVDVGSSSLAHYTRVCTREADRGESVCAYLDAGAVRLLIQALKEQLRE